MSKSQKIADLIFAFFPMVHKVEVELGPGREHEERKSLLTNNNFLNENLVR